MSEIKRQALVVGINRYPFLKETATSEAQHLTTAVQDADAIARILELYGDFEVFRLPTESDKWRFNPTKEVKLEQLESAITELFCPTVNSKPHTALLFFAGKGLRRVYDNGETEGFLATSDSNAIRQKIGPQKIKWGISLKWLRQLLQQSPVQEQIVWLDCAFSGELFNFTEIDAEQPKRDRCFIVAAASSEEAYADDKHGLLTHTLLQALDPKKNPDGKVSNYTIVDFIKATDFSLHSKEEMVTQHPDYRNQGDRILLTRNRITQDWLELKEPHRLEKLWMETKDWFSEKHPLIKHTFDPNSLEKSIDEFKKVLKITDWTSTNFFGATETAAFNFHESIKSFCGECFCGQKPTGNYSISIGGAYVIALIAYQDAWPNYTLEPLTKNVKNEWENLPFLKSRLLPLQETDCAQASAKALYDLFFYLFKANHFEEKLPQIENAFFQNDGTILKIFTKWKPNEKYHRKESLAKGLYTQINQEKEIVRTPEYADNAKSAIIRLWRNMLLSKNGFLSPGIVYMGVDDSGEGQLVVASVE